MNRIVWTLLSGGVILAGCQSSPFQSANREPMRPTGDIDRRNSRDDGKGGLTPNAREKSSLFASRMGAGPIVRPRQSEQPDLRGTGRRDDRTHYQQLLAKDPDNAFAHHKLAILADQAGDYPTAAQHYRVALRLKGNDPDLLNDIGYSNLLQNRLNDSERYLRQAHRIAPNDRRINANLGTLYAKMGETDLAYNHFRQAGDERYARAMIAESLRNSPGLTETQLAGSRRSPATNLQAPDPNAYGRPSTGFASRNDRFDDISPNDETRRIAEMMRRAKEEDLARRGQSSMPNGYDARNFSRENPYQFTGYDDRNPRDSRTPSRSPSYDPRDNGGVRNPNFPPRTVPDNRLKDAMRQIDVGDSRSGSPIRHAGGSLPDWNNGDNSRGTALPGERDHFGTRQPEFNRQPGHRGSSLWPPDGQDSNSFGTPIRPASTQRTINPSRGLDDRRDLPTSIPRDSTTDRGLNAAQREALLMGHNTGGGVPFPIPGRNTTQSGTPGQRPADIRDAGNSYTRFDRSGTVTRSAGYRNPQMSDPRGEMNPNGDSRLSAPRYDSRGDDYRSPEGHRPNGFDDYNGISIQPRVKTGISYTTGGGRSGYSQ